MKIDGHELEKRAMEAFHRGDRAEGHRLQDAFLEAFRTACQEADHCSCQKACPHHGNCRECVAIHRAHEEHVPNCFRPMLNRRLKALSELTEHTIALEVEPPKESKR